MEGGSATISSEDAGAKGDCSEIFSVANNDFADDVINSSKPLKDGIFDGNVFIKLGSNKEVPEMVVDSMDAAPETTKNDGA